MPVPERGVSPLLMFFDGGSAVFQNQSPRPLRCATPLTFDCEQPAITFEGEADRGDGRGNPAGELGEVGVSSAAESRRRPR
jgi:hypothetical protein